MLSYFLPFLFLLPPSPDTELDASERAKWYAQLQWPEACETAYQQNLGQRRNPIAGLRFFTLPKQQYLVEVLCYGGAYQPGLVFMHYDPTTGQAVPLQLQTYNEFIVDGWAEFAPDTASLTLYTKGIGVGGCGQWTQYQWQAETAILVLQQARHRSCENLDENELDPTQWPLMDLD